MWVIVAANLMAMLIQTLSAKLGIATGPEPAGGLPRAASAARVTFLLWLQAEAIAMATDLAEFLGAAIGFHLLFGIGLFPSAVLTGVAAFAILGLQRFGFRPLEAVIATLVGVIGVCYVAELGFAHPDYGAVLHARGRAAVRRQRGGAALGRDPRRDRDAARDLPALGADAGPHRRRRPTRTRRRCCATRASTSSIAMTIAGLINVAMLVMAAIDVLQERAPARRLARGRAQDARADPRRRVERALRARAARLRPLELGGRDARPARS